MSFETATTNVPRIDDIRNRPDYKERSQYKMLTFYAQFDDVKFFLKLRKEQGIIKEYACILHDHDTFDDGSLKKEHIHAIVYYNSQTTDQRPQRDFKACKFLQKDGNEAVIHYVASLLNRQSAYCYLTHRNEPSKHQYSDDDVYCSQGARDVFDCAVSRGDTEELNTASLILEDMLSGVSLRDIVKAYGKDFVYHYHCFKELVNDIRHSEFFKELNKNG